MSRRSLSDLVRLLAGVGLAALVIGIAGCGGSSAEPSALVAPHGAPYSYRVPHGFALVSATFPGPSPRFLTTVVPKGTSHTGTLSAFQWTLAPAQRGYSTSRLLAWLDSRTLSFYRGTGATLKTGTRTQVAGHDAVCWTIHDFRNASDGLVDVDGCAIVASHDVVQQACTWKPNTRAVIQHGCEALRASLKVS